MYYLVNMSFTLDPSIVGKTRSLELQMDGLLNTEMQDHQQTKKQSIMKRYSQVCLRPEMPAIQVHESCKLKTQPPPPPPPPPPLLLHDVHGHFSGRMAKLRNPQIVLIGDMRLLHGA